MHRRNCWPIAILATGLWMMACGLSVAQESASSQAEPGAETRFDDAALEFFEKEVRPILTGRCLECHGGGKGDPKGGLRMDSRASLLKGGDTEPALVPGKPKESLLISAINYGDLYQMPPKSKLPAKEIATLTKWVELGAPWPKEAKSSAGQVKPFDLAARKAEHWCWRPVTDHAPPAVKDEAWPFSSTDRFILAKLEAKGLKPATPAEKHTLLRRVYFDLTGLPPSPEEVAAFVNDTSPQALEHVVDRLLDSVHFGERWARHWLDLVRYAETRGHEFEPIIPNAWQYRDYVIRAINADVPYDRFLTEHIAGDLIQPRWRDAGHGRGPAAGLQPSTLSPQPSINESILGTGFWFLGEEVHSPVDIRKDETDRMDNRLDVMTKTFLGLTVACARCHDHKFDAISQKDYYALTGFLISGSYRQVRVQTHEHDLQIAKSLDEFRSKARRETARLIADAALPIVSKLDQYLLAAHQAVEAGLLLEDADAAAVDGSDLVFADFEGDSWGEWKTEGTAFGDRPPRKSDNAYDAPLEGFQGERLVNSHRNAIEGANNAGTRDAQIGRLISPTFKIDRNIIRFLIGGGAHTKRTCMNLIVGGKVVRTATGQNSGSLKPQEWKVGDLKGKEARIEIVDAERGGWGHILVDQIVFTNSGTPSTEPRRTKRIAAASQEKVNELAARHTLDAGLLSRWCVELAVAKSDNRHPLHGFVVPKPASKDANATSEAGKNVPPPEGLVVDFGSPRAGDLSQSGVSFGIRPTEAGQLVFIGSAENPALHVAAVGGWERDLFWKDIKLAPGTEDDHGGLGSWHRHGRMVQSPEFTLNSGKLWYLIRGSVRVYAAVNSHLVVAGPLHGSLLREFKQADAEWHWVNHGLELYRGHRLHVEFSPADDGACGVAMIVQSENAPKSADVGIDLNDAFAAESPAQRAKQLQGRFQTVLSQFAQKNGEPRSGANMASRDATLANWLMERRELFTVTPELPAVATELNALRDREAELATRVQWESQLAPAMLDGNGVDEQLLIRGNSSTPKGPVHRRFLEALSPDEASHSADGRVESAVKRNAPAIDSHVGSGRLELAGQMLDSPLAARVAVNRVWYHLFGRGIVPTVDNLGVLGQEPTHPELLDHLTTQFVKNGWSQKRLIKSLILSRTYQMSSKPTEADAADPDNLLWHRMPIKRLEGEVIRDSLLAVSGRLDPTPFGPSVPIHLTPFMEGRGRPGVNGPVDGNGRRSIYISVRRNFLSPMMLAFDTPSPFSTVGRRTSSNVPAQALILMNDPLVIEQAKRWAERLLADPTQTPEQRIDAMYLTAFARNATDAEKSEALGFLDSQSTRFGLPDSQRRTSPQAWADLCHVLFNVKEFVFIE